MAKVYYSNIITTDDGQTLEVSGWYYKDCEYIGEQTIYNVTDCFSEMA